jgi:hypothetical protein
MAKGAPPDRGETVETLRRCSGGIVRDAGVVVLGGRETGAVAGQGGVGRLGRSRCFRNLELGGTLLVASESA